MNPLANRRHFMLGAGALSLGLAAGCSPADVAEGENKSIVPPVYGDVLGVQLYTVRDLFEADAQATLKALAEIGVKDCETAGLFDHKAGDVRAMMDDLGLISRSGHVRLPALREGLSTDLEIAGTLGQDKLYLGWIPEEERTPDGYRALADLLNERGEQTKKAGVMLGYHNHEFEFDEVDGEAGYDILLERTQADLVTMELDFFWAAEANVDPIALFEKAPGRFTSCHIKDRARDGEMVSVGDGVIAFKDILPAAAQAGIERFYVEHDNPADPLVSIGRSFTHLLPA